MYKFVGSVGKEKDCGGYMVGQVGERKILKCKQTAAPHAWFTTY